MAYLIPDNLKSRKDVSETTRRVAGAFQVGLDEDVLVWFEPLYDPAGDKPHFVVLLPALGIVVLEVLGVKPRKSSPWPPRSPARCTATSRGR